jgi:hydrocephalus-inducing protein
LEIKNGPRYNLELRANITIPEITIENLQSDLIDFQNVIIGQRKTIFIRFVNNKEITCEWSLNTRIEMIGCDKGAENRFSITPNSGVIQPGQKQLVSLSFTPNSASVMNYKFSISVKENPKNLVISVRGSGTFVSLEIIKDRFEIGPVLPYDD